MKMLTWKYRILPSYPTKTMRVTLLKTTTNLMPKRYGSRSSFSSRPIRELHRPTVEASSGGTPRTYNSMPYWALRDQLHNCSYIKVVGFFEKYFDNKSWMQESKNVFDAVKHTYSDNRWTTFPSTPTENAVWEWWSNFQDKHLSEARGVYYTTKSKNEIVDTDGARQLDFFVKSRDASTSHRHNWADVRVIGEYTASQDGEKKFLQLVEYANNIFSAQPRRRFVHGFILSHSRMELHVFDRSGTFSQEPFDIHKDPERFIRVISGYCMMSDEELGLDTFIERKGQHEYVTVVDVDGKDRRLRLGPRPIVCQGAIVGRGTSCYSSADGQSMIKFSWVSASKSPSGLELLKLANERKVKGVPRLIGALRDISTSELRSPLAFAKERHMEEPLYSMNQQADRPFVDRVLCIQATQPAGRRLADFHDVRELLQALRDAIKVHRSLYLDGQILHRNISKSNIIIVNPDDNEGLSGTLIDLDWGTIMVNGKNTRKRSIGTLRYMAIEVLEMGMSGARPDLEHTYRHDLESFFYVFLDICLRHGWNDGQASMMDPLGGFWRVPHPDTILVTRMVVMRVGGFESEILPHFSPTFECLKGLATSLRDILFLRLDKLRTGTPAGSPSILYDQMIDAFDKAVESCNK